MNIRANVRVWAAPALILATLLLSVCAKKKDFTIQNIATFQKMADGQGKNPKACEEFFNRSVRPTIKREAPAVLERTYLYTGRSEYSDRELEGIVRCFLFGRAVKAKNPAEAKSALAFLDIAFQGRGAERSGAYTRLKAANDLPAFKEAVKAVPSDLIGGCLADIETLRSNDEKAAEKRLTDLRFLLFLLPENESQVMNITRTLWDNLDRNVNDVAVGDIRQMLQGAYPGLSF